MIIMTYIFAFMLFACIGSFIGVCVGRIPKGEQIWKGRSHCDVCGKALKPFELIPIFSYLFLGGRCSKCKSRIAIINISIEIITATLGTLCLIIYGLTVQGIAYGIVTCILIEVAFVDQKIMEISDLAVLMIAAVGIVLMICNGSYLSSLIGLVCVSLPFVVFVLCRAMGLGDVKLMAAVGILLGYKSVLLAAFIGIVVGCFAAVALKIANKKGWKSEMAFGPYLCIGTYVAMLCGDRMVSLYLSLLQ